MLLVDDYDDARDMLRFVLEAQGYRTVEARDAMGFRCLDNLDAFSRGEAPPHAVA